MVLIRIPRAVAPLVREAARRRFAEGLEARGVTMTGGEQGRDRRHGGHSPHGGTTEGMTFGVTEPGRLRLRVANTIRTRAHRAAIDHRRRGKETLPLPEAVEFGPLLARAAMRSHALALRGIPFQAIV